ncbi:MAG: PKD domain-containing protein, partial [Bacteroidetes bacterium]|nr:PKD domain-containing protein [Bacteroidota bacterium]
VAGLPAFLPDFVAGNTRTVGFTHMPDNTRCSTVDFSGTTTLSGQLRWEWDFGDGSNGSGQAVTHTYQGPDSAIVTLKVTTTTPCGNPLTLTSKEKIAIVVGPLRAGFTHSPPCVNIPVTFTDTSSISNPTGVSWSFGDGSGSQDANPQHTYAAPGSYAVQHTVSSASGCTAVVTKNIVIERPAVNAGNDTTIAAGQPLRLQATGAASYIWSPAAAFDNPFVANPLSQPQQSATYFLSGVSAAGCTGYDTLQVKVYKDVAIYVPGAFTPDGNGHNDFLIPALPGVQRLDYFSVYNRLGQMIFTTTRPGEGWDGRFNGRAQPSGTYVWIIRVKDYLGVTRQRKGTVLLLR